MVSVLAFMYYYLLVGATASAQLVHKCWDMGDRTVGSTTFLFVLSSFLLFLAPLLSTPIVALTVLSVMTGKCKPRESLPASPCLPTLFFPFPRAFFSSFL